MAKTSLLLIVHFPRTRMADYVTKANFHGYWGAEAAGVSLFSPN